MAGRRAGKFPFGRPPYSDTISRVVEALEQRQLETRDALRRQQSITEEVWYLNGRGTRSLLQPDTRSITDPEEDVTVQLERYLRWHMAAPNLAAQFDHPFTSSAVAAVTASFQPVAENTVGISNTTPPTVTPGLVATSSEAADLPVSADARISKSADTSIPSVSSAARVVRNVLSLDADEAPDDIVPCPPAIHSPDSMRETSAPANAATASNEPMKASSGHLRRQPYLQALSLQRAGERALSNPSTVTPSSDQPSAVRADTDDSNGLVSSRESGQGSPSSDVLSGGHPAVSTGAHHIISNDVAGESLPAIVADRFHSQPSGAHAAGVDFADNGHSVTELSDSGSYDWPRKRISSPIARDTLSASSDSRVRVPGFHELASTHQELVSEHEDVSPRAWTHEMPPAPNWGGINHWSTVSASQERVNESLALSYTKKLPAPAAETMLTPVVVAQYSTCTSASTGLVEMPSTSAVFNEWECSSSANTQTAAHNWPTPAAATLRSTQQLDFDAPYTTQLVGADNADVGMQWAEFKLPTPPSLHASVTGASATTKTDSANTRISPPSQQHPAPSLIALAPSEGMQTEDGEFATNRPTPTSIPSYATDSGIVPRVPSTAATHGGEVEHAEPASHTHGAPEHKVEGVTEQAWVEPSSRISPTPHTHLHLDVTHTHRSASSVLLPVLPGHLARTQVCATVSLTGTTSQATRPGVWEPVKEDGRRATLPSNATAPQRIDKAGSNATAESSSPTWEHVRAAQYSVSPRPLAPLVQAPESKNATVQQVRAPTNGIGSAPMLAAAPTPSSYTIPRSQPSPPVVTHASDATSNLRTTRQLTAPLPVATPPSAASTTVPMPPPILAQALPFAHHSAYLMHAHQTIPPARMVTIAVDATRRSRDAGSVGGGTSVGADATIGSSNTWRVACGLSPVYAPSLMKHTRGASNNMPSDLHALVSASLQLTQSPLHVRDVASRGERDVTRSYLTQFSGTTTIPLQVAPAERHFSSDGRNEYVRDSEAENRHDRVVQSALADAFRTLGSLGTDIAQHYLKS